MPALLGTALAEIDLDVDPSTAWKMLTDDDLLSAWIGDGSHIDPEVGGAAVFEDLETGSRRCGTVTDVAPGERLGFVWWPEADPSAASEVAFEIEQNDDGCTVRISETCSAAAAPKARASWQWRTFALASLACALVSVR